MDDLIDTLYRRHAQELTTALALSLGNREEAADLAHEVFIQAMRQEDRLRAHPDPRGWLFRTGYNLARSRWRLLLRRRHKLAQQRPVLPPAAWEDAVDLRNSLQALSRRQRDAVILHYYLGFDLAETANLLGCAEGTIHSHLNRARKALERSFEPKEANC